MDPLDKIYTAAEAAERLRTTRRIIIKVGRELGACSVFRGKYMFSEADLLTIWHAKRALPIETKTGFLRELRSQHAYDDLLAMVRKREKSRRRR